MENGTGAITHSMAVPPKLRIEFCMIQQFHCWVYTQKNQNLDLKRYLYTYIHSSIIRNTSNVEATQVSIDRWMDKQNVNTYICANARARTHTMELYPALNMEGNSAMYYWYNMDEPWRHHAKRNKPNTSKTNTVIPLTRGTCSIKIIKTQSTAMVARGWWEERMGRYCLTRRDFSVTRWKDSRGWTVVMAAHQCQCI